MADYRFRQYDFGEGRGVRFDYPVSDAFAPGESLSIEGELYLPNAAAGTVVTYVVLDLVRRDSATDPWEWDDYDTLDPDVYVRLEYPVNQAWQANTPIPFAFTVAMTQAIADKAAALGEDRYFHADIHFAFRTETTDFGYFDTQYPTPRQCVNLLRYRTASGIGTPVWADENPRDFYTALGGMLQRMSWLKLEVPVTVDPYGNSPVSLRCQIGENYDETWLNPEVVEYDQHGPVAWKFVNHFGAPDFSGTYQVTLTLTDERGGTATRTTTLVYIPYAPPALTGFLPERYITVLTEDEPVYQASEDGVDVWLSYAGSVQAFDGGNANGWTLTLSWWPDGDETAAQSRTLESDANGRALLAQEDRSLFPVQLSAAITWKLRLTLQDWVGNRAIRLVELEKAGNLFNVEPYGVAVGMRSTATAAEPNKFEVAEDWKKCGIFPVGTIYLSVDSTNPAAWFGGTWVSFGTGRVLVGVDPNDADFASAQLTGGEKRHTLTVNEMPAHSHTFKNAKTGGSGSARWIIDSSSSGTGNTSSTGGGQAHNNLQPYITCYMWLRTA